jgi:serine/threonine protein kinase
LTVISGCAVDAGYNNHTKNMTLQRGTILNNRYRVVEILGQGGMGSVYRAVDENLGVEVALKENLFTTDEYARQFRREAVILATLRHAHLTRVTDHFVIEGQGQYLVMDYIEGEDLRQRMDRLGAINEEEAIIIGAAICDALSYLHSRTPPVVHRDIKPGNVKITPQGQIFLVDFGLAKLIHVGQSTTTGARAMTPGYSPPEQYGTARTDSRSDIFSLGATLYAALTGTIPEDALARAMDQVKLTPLRKRDPDISRRLASVIDKSLAVRPDDRYQTAEEFKSALLNVRGITTRRRKGDYKVAPPPQALLEGGGYQSDPISDAFRNEQNAGLGTPDYPIPSSELLDESRFRSPSPSGRRRWLVLSLSILVIVLVGVAAYFYYPSWPDQALAFFIPSGTETVISIIDDSTTTATSPDSPTPFSFSTVTPSPSVTLTPSPTPSATIEPTLSPTLVPPSMTPTFTPTPLGGGSGQIAFASDRSGTTQIWLLTVDGSAFPRMLTDIPEGACQPAWSPDGMRLVFTSPCESNEEFYPGSGLFIINVDGSGVMPLPNVPGGDFDPAWSPDGKQIVFTSMRTGGRPRVYLINLEDNEVGLLSEQYSYDRQPAWSRDGQKIAFVTTQKGPVQIWTMDPNGDNQEIFTRSGDKINTHPDWSMDGELILFTQIEAPGRVPGLAAASYDEGGYSEFRFDFGSVPIRDPKYSPDGLWLVFESWPEGRNHDVYLMAASGAGRTRLTESDSFDFDPDWRPNTPPLE